MEIAIAIMAIFAVFGAMTFLEDICKCFLRHGSYDRIIIYVKSDSSRVEGVVRSLMIKNPTAEIVILNEENKAELRCIIDKLCCDYPCIHIGTLE